MRESLSPWWLAATGMHISAFAVAGDTSAALGWAFIAVLGAAVTATDDFEAGWNR